MVFTIKQTTKLFPVILLVFSLVKSADSTLSTVPPSLIYELLALNRDIGTAAKPKYLSPADMTVSPDNTRLFVAEQTAKQIAVIDLTNNTVIRKIKLPNEVTGLAVSQDGSKVYATCSSEIWPSGIVCEVDAAAGKVLRRIPAGHSARSPVISPDGTTLYVCNTFNNSISVIDIAAGRETRRIPVIREPYSARLTPDGSVLVVANSLPNEKSTDSLNISCKISLIDAVSGNVTANIPLTVGSHSVFGMAISPDGAYAFATHLIGMFNIPATIITNGWIHTNNVAVIDIARKKLLNDMTLDYSEEGAANPWGIDCTDDGKFLCIAHSGSNEISIINMPAMIDSASQSNDLSRKFSVLYPNTIRRRVGVSGLAPRALTIVGNK
ncbi:MAG TPA: YncE family protein, partial [Chitinispirillaceae bacterium]|nr:YncE family protein [Chitinispirillaceae bacterium]